MEESENLNADNSVNNNIRRIDANEDETNINLGSIIESEPSLLEDVNLNPEQKEILFRNFHRIEIHQRRSHSGPLPDPSTLVEYNNAVPDAAERIIQMAEKQQQHRMEIEKAVVFSSNRQSSIGQILGFIIALVCIGGAVYLALNGYEKTAIVIATTTIIGLCTIFVLGKKAQKE